MAIKVFDVKETHLPRLKVFMMIFFLNFFNRAEAHEEQCNVCSIEARCFLFVS